MELLLCKLGLLGDISDDSNWARKLVASSLLLNFFKFLLGGGGGVSVVLLFFKGKKGNSMAQIVIPPVGLFAEDVKKLEKVAVGSSLFYYLTGGMRCECPTDLESTLKETYNRSLGDLDLTEVYKHCAGVA